ncbi:amino acid adenylation domain-containing protein [Nonomuraea sp. NPDC049129]|uniref:amino acid adenylation domain-containing protein n=1 Tax=Nonomuraea sp. NPDC049129 TaxID=3155272 RepID=UPI0033FFFFBF
MTKHDLPGLRMRPGGRELAVRRALRRSREVDLVRSVCEHVLTHATLDADGVAVLDDRNITTYEELVHKIGRIRALLLREGCGPGSRVGLLGWRGSEMIASFLAIESIGGVYVPIDAGWPAARIAEVLESAKVACLLRTGEGPEGRAEIVDGKKGLPEPHAPWVPYRMAGVDAAYIIHTSGSTGRPKGTVVEHQSMLNHLWSMVADLRLKKTDTVGFTASPGHIIAIWQMVAALMVGGSVAVVDDRALRFPRQLLDALQRTGVTTLELVPTILGWMTNQRSRSSAELPRLRTVISTGEKLHPPLAARICSAFPQAELLNAYGATEVSDDVALHLVSASDTNDSNMPIGTPIANSVLYALVPEADGWRAAEPEEVGELWVGGLPVSAGYLDDPELTRARFFRDDLDERSPTRRLYRTGDLVRFSNGIAYCLGRTDRQIKVAGVRVEPGEIEAVLMRHPHVDLCAVTASAEACRPELTVHYVTRNEVDEVELREFLLGSLPGVAIPRRWIPLNHMPMNSSGKIDYQRLTNGG